jgi:hypothetical protein
VPTRAEIVGVTSLWRTVAAALIAASSVVLLFSFAVLGGVRFDDHRRQGPSVSAAGWGLVFAVGLAGSLAAIVLGLIVMVDK